MIYHTDEVADRENRFFDASEENTHAEKANMNGESSLEQLQGELDTCKRLQQDWHNKYLQVRADLDNFQRRTSKERAAWVQQAQMDLLTGLLDMVDNFDRALEQFQKADDQVKKTCGTWVDGFALIRASLQKYLEANDVKPMDNYATFDPMFHEALMQVVAEGKQSGAIVDVLQKGYLYRDAVLRVAKVSVAQ